MGLFKDKPWKVSHTFEKMWACVASVESSEILFRIFFRHPNYLTWVKGLQKVCIIYTLDAGCDEFELPET